MCITWICIFNQIIDSNPCLNSYIDQTAWLAWVAILFLSPKHSKKSSPMNWMNPDIIYCNITQHKWLVVVVTLNLGMSPYWSWLRKCNLIFFFWILSGTFISCSRMYFLLLLLFEFWYWYFAHIFAGRGGPDYKKKDKLRLTISDVAMEDFIMEVFKSYSFVSMVALKLPVNYDNQYLEEFAQRNNFSYQFFDREFKKMTLTILMRRVQWRQ